MRILTNADGDDEVTLAQLAKRLPYAFHDAQVGSIEIDLLNARISIAMKVITSISEKSPIANVQFSQIIVTLNKVLAFTVQGVGDTYSQVGDWLKVQGFIPKPEVVESIPVLKGLDSQYIYGFFIHDLNDSMYFAAGNATSTWK